MSTPHIEHFVDERGNLIYRAEVEGSFLSKDEVKALGKHVSGILDENAKLRELARDMYGNYRAGWNEEIEDELYDRMRELGVDA